MGEKCSVLHWCTLHLQECDPTVEQVLPVPCSQQLIAGPYPESSESSSHTHTFSVEDPILILGSAIQKPDEYFSIVTGLWP